VRWLVDGLNVIGSRPDGWWRDRHGAMVRLVAQLEGFAAASGERVTVVFEKPPAPPIEATAVEVAYAPRARPNAADDEIVRRSRRTRPRRRSSSSPPTAPSPSGPEPPAPRCSRRPASGGGWRKVPERSQPAGVQGRTKLPAPAVPSAKVNLPRAKRLPLRQPASSRLSFLPL
jgi:hypothetical protein